MSGKNKHKGTYLHISTDGSDNYDKVFCLNGKTENLAFEMPIEDEPKITFMEALKKLGIEDYAERIFKSNSHGELFHLQQYVDLAEVYVGTPEEFRQMFLQIVDYANKNWRRPESVYQHILKIILDSQ